MKESHKQTLGTMKAGFVKLVKIIWIGIKSFFEAITIDLYDNIKKYWAKDLKKNPEIKKPVEKEPLP